MTSTLTRRTVLLAFFLGLCSSTAYAKGARGPEKVFKGKVLFSKKRFPRVAKSVRGYVAKLKKQKTSKLWEDPKKQVWKIHFAAFFKSKPTSIEVTVKIYDVTSGRRLISSFEQYLGGGTQKSYLSKLEITREELGSPNRRVMIVVEDRTKKTLAVGTVKLLGKANKHKGQVDFSADET